MVSDVLVDGVSVGAVNTYTFEAVNGAHTIEATFKKAGTRPAWNPFTDVHTDDWFHDSVKYVYENDLMVGTSGDKFSPDLDTSRAMVATILWRLEGSPAMGGGTNSPFPDVPKNTWYTEAVEWAASVGVVLGYDTGKFGPGDPITREQMAAMLYRYAGSPAANAALSGFTDADSASSYARPALRWAVEQGILIGRGGGILDPTGKATRAETAAMLQRFCETIK